VTLGDDLARLAGGDLELLNLTRSDRQRYTAIGGVLVTTAAVASVSAAFAVHMALKLPAPLAFLVGLGWGFVILNLDRLLVMQMTRSSGRLGATLIAVPRLMLAIVLGVVISTPLVLQIFGPEIATEIQVMHREDQDEFQRSLASDTRYREIPVLERKIRDGQQLVDSGGSTDVSQDPAVKTADKQAADAAAALRTAEKAVICEKEGRCGSGKAGAGIAFDEKVALRSRAQREYSAADKARTEARAAAAARLADSAQRQVSTARQNLIADQARLKELTSARNAAQAAFQAESQNDDGMLARLKALGKLTDGDTTIRLVHDALFLLFLAIEVLPVLVKLMQLWAPPTAYERLVAQVEEETVYREAQVQRERSDAAAEAETADLERDRLERAAALVLTRDRIDQQVKLGQEATAEVVERQREILELTLSAWAEEAKRAAQEDLTDWKASRRRQSVQLPHAPANGHHVIDVDQAAGAID
jgi:hypothetical protein